MGIRSEEGHLISARRRSATPEPDARPCIAARPIVKALALIVVVLGLVAALGVRLSNNGVLAKEVYTPQPEPLIHRTVGTPVIISCIGDSITGSYPPVMQRLLDERYGAGAFVVNMLGESGAGLQRTSNDPYIGRPNWPRALNAHSDVVTIMLGTNDSRGGNWRDEVRPCLLVGVPLPTQTCPLYVFL